MNVFAFTAVRPARLPPVAVNAPLVLVSVAARPFEAVPDPSRITDLEFIPSVRRASVPPDAERPPLETRVPPPD